MIKQNKITLIITSIFTLLPIIVGCIIWNLLPEKVPFHWDVNGNVDGYASRFICVFLTPLIMLATLWLCVGLTLLDPKHKNINKKQMAVVLWIIPIISIIVNSFTYLFALNITFNVLFVVSLLLGVAFIIIGNMLPKVRQNFSLGYKLHWTINSEANWNATHRFGGFVQCICGVLIILLSFLQSIWVIIGVTFISVLSPIVYSFIYYLKYDKK